MKWNQMETRKQVEICNYHPNEGTVFDQWIWCMRLDKGWLPSHGQLFCNFCCNKRIDKSTTKYVLNMHYMTVFFLYIYTLIHEKLFLYAHWNSLSLRQTIKPYLHSKIFFIFLQRTPMVHTKASLYTLVVHTHKNFSTRIFRLPLRVTL